MAAHAAQIIDLNAYRQSRATARPMSAALPIAYVAWWTFIPVVFVPRFA